MKTAVVGFALTTAVLDFTSTQMYPFLRSLYHCVIVE